MSATEGRPPATGELTIRPMRNDDVDAADRIMRTAFGTHLGAPNPVEVFGDAQYVRPRYAAAPEWAFTAELDGDVVGSNFATRWGSFGFFGPLTVRPELWNGGIAKALMEPILDLFDRWQLRQAALFTFPESPKHVGLYQRFGFWPQQLTPLLERPVDKAATTSVPSTFATRDASRRAEVLRACQELTDSIFPGLDLTHEITAATSQSLGDTLLVEGEAGLDGFAVCHLGAGEAGSGTCFVKFAAARPGRGAAERFERVVVGVEALAAEHGLQRIVAGVNTTRHDAYRLLLERGYRAWLNGIIMQRPNDAGYCRPDAYVIDDLR